MANYALKVDGVFIVVQTGKVPSVTTNNKEGLKKIIQYNSKKPEEFNSAFIQYKLPNFAGSNSNQWGSWYKKHQEFFQGQATIHDQEDEFTKIFDFCEKKKLDLAKALKDLSKVAKVSETDPIRITAARLNILRILIGGQELNANRPDSFAQSKIPLNLADNKRFLDISTSTLFSGAVSVQSNPKDKPSYYDETLIASYDIFKDSLSFYQTFDPDSPYDLALFGHELDHLFKDDQKKPISKEELEYQGNLKAGEIFIDRIVAKKQPKSITVNFLQKEILTAYKSDYLKTYPKNSPSDEQWNKMIEKRAFAHGVWVVYYSSLGKSVTNADLLRRQHEDKLRAICEEEEVRKPFGEDIKNGLTTVLDLIKEEYQKARDANKTAYDIVSGIAFIRSGAIGILPSIEKSIVDSIKAAEDKSELLQVDEIGHLLGQIGKYIKASIMVMELNHFIDRTFRQYSEAPLATALPDPTLTTKPEELADETDKLIQKIISWKPYASISARTNGIPKKTVKQ